MATTIDGQRSATPVHLWIVGLLATLWNAFGCYDYLMTRMRNTDYLKSMMPDVDPNAMLAYVDSMPVWAAAGWGLGVWMGLAGSLLLLTRSRHAVWTLGLSFVGAVVGIGYQLMNPMAGMSGGMATVMPIVVIVVALALFLYARAMARKGVLA
jgi:hypothetical protein